MSASPISSARIAMVGCGNIAPVYVKTIKELGWIEIAAFVDGVPGRAESFAQQHGGIAASLEDVLADQSIDVVLNLTPAHVHAGVTRQIIAGGKSVFSEKPLASTFADGQAIVAAATAKGVQLGCAPDTFLGAGLQAARAAIDKGLIGVPIGANAFMLGFGPEWWHPNPEIFYGDGAGPLFDMGPYYLTALTTLLGPAQSVFGSAKVGVADRVVHAKGRVGDVVRATAPTHVSSVIEFVSGPTATLVTSFDVKASRFKNIEIYGSEATLSVPDPNTFGGPLQIRSILDTDWRTLPLEQPNIPQQRGIGLADMLSSRAANRPHRASGDLALHVLELMDGTLRSSTEGRRVDLSTSIDRPSPLNYSLPANTFD
jgi:predicted dehydrogenase